MLKVKKLHPDAFLPTVAHPGEDMAYDLYALERVVLEPGSVASIRTGIAAQHDNWFTRRIGLLIRDRSSMAAKGIVVSGGVIDPGYTGEITVLLTLMEEAYLDYDPEAIGQNKVMYGYLIKQGDKIAQMIPIPVITGDVVEVDNLSLSARGEKGFGSSGR